MTFEHSIFSKDCPIGHINTLENTSILLPEGLLRACTACGHLVSACSRERYDQSMQEFNTSERTLPRATSINRSFELHAKRLKLIQETLGLPIKDIHILDIGFSS